MPADGMKRLLQDTGIALGRIIRELSGSRAGKRILFFDACRESPVKNQRGAGPSMTAAFSRALKAAPGPGNPGFLHRRRGKL